MSDAKRDNLRPWRSAEAAEAVRGRARLSEAISEKLMPRRPSEAVRGRRGYTILLDLGNLVDEFIVVGELT